MGVLGQELGSEIGLGLGTFVGNRVVKKFAGSYLPYKNGGIIKPPKGHKTDMDYYFILQGLPRLARTYSITTEILQKLDRCLDTLNAGEVYKGFNEHIKPIELLTLTLDEWDRQKVEMMG